MAGVLRSYLKRRSLNLGRSSPLVVCGTPGLVWVVAIHAFEEIEGLQTQIFGKGRPHNDEQHKYG